MPEFCDASLAGVWEQNKSQIPISQSLIAPWLFQQDPLIILITLDSRGIQSGLSWVMELLETSTFQYEYLGLLDEARVSKKNVKGNSRHTSRIPKPC